MCAYIIPENFEPKYCGVEITAINEDTYATLTITDPHSDFFGKIPRGYEILLEVNDYSYQWFHGIVQ